MDNEKCKCEQCTCSKKRSLILSPDKLFKGFVVIVALVTLILMINDIINLN